MLRLNSENLAQESSDYLTSRQNEIDALAVFKDKAERAISLWVSKSASSFKSIKEKLVEMCVGVEICVYCENNEATDVEHIYPKKLYPEKAFVWENYVLACGKCNSHHKSDKFKIFKLPTSAEIENVAPPRGTYLQPANADALFINQRQDNPLDYLELDLLEQTFLFTEKFPEGTRGYYRAAYTIELLGLNTRGALVAARKSAARFFIGRLEKYVNAKQSVDFQELKDAVDDFGTIDETANFTQEKNRVLESIKRDILENSHPTVWKELIRQRANLPKTNNLLNNAPEAENW